MIEAIKNRPHPVAVESTTNWWPPLLWGNVEGQNVVTKCLGHELYDAVEYRLITQTTPAPVSLDLGFLSVVDKPLYLEKRIACDDFFPITAMDEIDLANGDVEEIWYTQRLLMGLQSVLANDDAFLKLVKLSKKFPKHLKVKGFLLNEEPTGNNIVLVGHWAVHVPFPVSSMDINGEQFIKRFDAPKLTVIERQLAEDGHTARLRHGMRGYIPRTEYDSVLHEVRSMRRDNVGIPLRVLPLEYEQALVDAGKMYAEHSTQVRKRYFA